MEGWEPCSGSRSPGSGAGSCTDAPSVGAGLLARGAGASTRRQGCIVLVELSLRMRAMGAASVLRRFLVVFGVAAAMNVIPIEQGKRSGEIAIPSDECIALHIPFTGGKRKSFQVTLWDNVGSLSYLAIGLGRYNNKHYFGGPETLARCAAVNGLPAFDNDDAHPTCWGSKIKSAHVSGYHSNETCDGAIHEQVYDLADYGNVSTWNVMASDAQGCKTASGDFYVYIMNGEYLVNGTRAATNASISVRRPRRSSRDLRGGRS